MQDHIRTFLERCGGHASSLAIAAHVLRLRNATPATADRVVSALLKLDARFAADGLGNWYLTQSRGASAPAAAMKVCLVFTPMSATELRKAERIVLGWQILPDAPIQLYEIVLRESQTPPQEENTPRSCSRQEFVRQHLTEWQECVLVGWNLATALSALKRITENFAEAWLPPIRIALQNLSRTLLQLSRPPQLAALHQQLLQTAPRSESWQDQMQAHAEIWRVLESRCVERGLENYEQIAHYAGKPQRASFAEYDFSEKDLEALPETPGVYIMKDRDERVIYVGKAVNLKERVRGYFANAFTEETKLRKMRERIARVHYEQHDTELDALLREQALIKRFRPPLNRQIEVHEQANPQPEKTRGIFLVPLRASLAPKTKGRVVVYFLSPQNLKRLPVNLARVASKRVRAVLADYAKPQTSVNAKQRTQAEIAARWFHQNRAWVSSLAPEANESIETTEARLMQLLHAPEIFHERVQLAS